MKAKRKENRWSLTLLISILVFLILAAAILLAAGVVILMVRLGVITEWSENTADISDLLLVMTVTSLILGMGLTTLLGNVFMQPINKLINLMNRLASGDYSARLTFNRNIRSHPTFREVEDSVNTMARELENTEMLRSDFINNFSHEFKTPIVSIAGFAKLLNRGNLTPAQQKEYLQVIEEESLRLSAMATNVLNLTKVENQTILTELTTYNLSEQIRDCVLLLESKWDQKNLELELEFGEHQIRANEELLKQVWINLLDNAVKFTPQGHTVRVEIREQGSLIEVSVINTGSSLTEEQQKNIWRKFYQAEESHAAQGNGIGLAIVKRVTELHGGRVAVSSENQVTAFTVTLPKNR